MPMETVRSRDGTTIAFDRTGRGPSLVVVGGALSGRGGPAAELAMTLADDLTVLTFDRRGRGDSGDTPPYAVEREIADLAAVMEAGRASFVLGHSSGGALSLRAAEAGLPIDRLAVYEPPLAVDEQRPAIPDDYTEHLEELVAAGRRGDAVAYFLTVGPLVPPSAVEQMRTSPAWAGMEAMAHTLAYDARVMDGLMTREPGPIRRWASLAMPILVLDGGASPPWIRNSAAVLARTLPNATTATLEGQGHGPTASLLAPVLRRFFHADGSSS